MSEEWRFDDDQYTGRDGACKFGTALTGRVSCYTPVVGQYVLIFTAGLSNLNLCNVELYGESM